MTRSILSIVSLFFRVQLGKKKLLFLLAMALLPALASLWWRLFEKGQAVDFIEQLVAGVILQFMALALSLWLGVSAIRDDVEDRTIVYLLVRPVKRSWVFGGRVLAAAFLVAGTLIVMVTLSILVAATGRSEITSGQLISITLRYSAGLALAGLVYTGLFSIFGTVLEKPFVPAVIFAVGWESTITNLPTGLSKLTLMYYLKSFIGIEPKSSGLLSVLFPPESPVDLFTSASVIVISCLLFFSISFWLAGKREWLL